MHKKIITILFLSLILLLPANAQADLAKKLSGYILLQVETHGEAWYLNPQDHKRYYLGKPLDAFNIMRQFGIGITNENLNKIPIGLISYKCSDSDGDGLCNNLEAALGTDPYKTDSDNDGYNDKKEIINNYNPLGSGKINIDKNFVQNNLGKIFLQTERNGEAWYLNPKDQKRYYLGRPIDAFMIMRFLSLGINNNNLNKITIGIINNQNNTNDSQNQDCGCGTENTNTYTIISNAASAIRAGNTQEALSYFVPEIQPAVKYTLNFLDDNGRLLLGNILSDAKLTQINDEQKIYSTEVYFNNEKVKINFIVKKQPDGKWLLTNL